MPLVGYTSHFYPGRVFTYDELMAELASDHNLTNFTPSLLQKALTYKGQEADHLNGTGLTATCPRELVLRRQQPYTLALENLGFALSAVHLREMLTSGIPPVGTAKNVRVEKDIPLPQRDAGDGRYVRLPATIDELVTDWREDGAGLIRIYKTTHRMPDKRGPYPLHRREVALFRLLLDPAFQGRNTISNDNSVGTRPLGEYDWRYGEVVYVCGDQTRRMQFEVDRPDFTIAWVKAWLLDVQEDEPISYAVATAPQAWDMSWKCGFCPVHEQCVSAPVKPKVVDPFEI